MFKRGRRQSDSSLMHALWNCPPVNKFWHRTYRNYMTLYSSSLRKLSLWTKKNQEKKQSITQFRSLWQLSENISWLQKSVWGLSNSLVPNCLFHNFVGWGQFSCVWCALPGLWGLSPGLAGDWSIWLPAWFGECCPRRLEPFAPWALSVILRCSALEGSVFVHGMVGLPPCSTLLVWLCMACGLLPGSARWGWGVPISLTGTPSGRTVRRLLRFKGNLNKSSCTQRFNFGQVAD